MMEEKDILKKPVSAKRIFKALMWTMIFLAAFIIVKDEVVWFLDGDDYYYEDEYYDEEYADESEVACNVAGLMLTGDLVTYAAGTEEGDEVEVVETASEDLVYWIEQAEADDAIKAILLEIDSFGGYPVAAEEVEHALKRAQKHSVAQIREYGDSAAYWAATGADVIFASENSDVGSIGITSSYLEYSGMNVQEGIKYVSLSTGKFKDAGSEDKPLTEEERQYFMRDLEILHDNFVKTVAENRDLDIEKVRALADGSSSLGRMALENGLIDKIGGSFEVEEYLREKIGEEPIIC
jgi:signal peptide peptidase SppA